MPTITTLSVIHNDDSGSGPAAQAVLAEFQKIQRDYQHSEAVSITVSQQYVEDDDE